jgi:hypothetical protein
MKVPLRLFLGTRRRVSEPRADASSSFSNPMFNGGVIPLDGALRIGSK